MKPHWFGVLLLIAAVAAYFTPSGGGHEPSFSDLYVFIGNFALFVFILWYLCRKPIAAAWAARRGEIERAVEHGRHELSAATARLQAAQSRMEQIERHRSELAAAMAQQAEDEAAALQRQAQLRAQQIAAQAKGAALAERRAGERALKAEVIDLAIAKATSRLSGELGADEDVHIREAALTGLKPLIMSRRQRQ